MSDSPKTLSAAECQALLDALLVTDGTPKQRGRGMRNRCIALLMLDAGLRVGEVIRLQISDVWFNNEPVTSLDIGDGVAEKDCTRRIPASARLSAAIIEAAFWLWMEDGEPKRGFAFYQGLPLRAITTRQIERFIRAAAEKVLQRPIHPHMLRHTFGTRLMRKTNARVVQELLGHKHLSSTQIYMNPNGDDLKGAIEAIDVEV